MPQPEPREVIIVGGGLAGLSAAIYLGRARRDVLVIDAGHSMAVWEPVVANYLGFPDGITGEALLERGRQQAEEFGAELLDDEVREVGIGDGCFELAGKRGRYRARRVLLATGLTHLPPDIPGVRACLGRSLFFCKDCDGYRVQGKEVAIIGANDDAVEYALGMLAFSPRVVVVTNGRDGLWDERHAAWLEEYEIPVHYGRIVEVMHDEGQVQAIGFEGGRRLAIDCAFATRGDVYHNHLARALGAEVDAEGQVLVDARMATTVPGLYAAGCLTPANCQMIIAAGQGASAAQAINRDLFEESLRTRSLRRCRTLQLRSEETLPEVLE